MFIPINENVDDVHNKRKSRTPNTERVVRKEGLAAGGFEVVLLLVIYSPNTVICPSLRKYSYE
tara:strand:- start:96 stop:284 length:189 start_codon:yes stop_codon:yes gene_type:complete